MPPLEASWRTRWSPAHLGSPGFLLKGCGFLCPHPRAAHNLKEWSVACICSQQYFPRELCSLAVFQVEVCFRELSWLERSLTVDSYLLLSLGEDGPHYPDSCLQGQPKQVWTQASFWRDQSIKHTFSKPTPKRLSEAERNNEKPDTMELVKNFSDETGKEGNPGRFTRHLAQVERLQGYVCGGVFMTLSSMMWCISWGL